MCIIVYHHHVMYRMYSLHVSQTSPRYILGYISDTSRYMYLGRFLGVTLDTYQDTSGYVYLGLTSSRYILIIAETRVPYCDLKLSLAGDQIRCPCVLCVSRGSPRVSFYRSLRGPPLLRDPAPPVFILGTAGIPVLQYMYTCGVCVVGGFRWL